MSTVPVNPNKGEYLGGAKATLWALNAATGAPEWSWDEVQNLWGNPGLNSGGGLWDTDSVVKLSPQGRLLWYYQLTPTICSTGICRTRRSSPPPTGSRW